MRAGSLPRDGSTPVPARPTGGQVNAPLIAGTAAASVRLAIPMDTWPSHASPFSAAALLVCVYLHHDARRRLFELVVLEPRRHELTPLVVERKTLDGFRFTATPPVVEQGDSIRIRAERSAPTDSPRSGWVRLVPSATVGSDIVKLAPVVEVPLYFHAGDAATGSIVQVPVHASPSFARTGGSLRWQLETSVDDEISALADIPVEVITPPPSIANARPAAVRRAAMSVHAPVPMPLPIPLPMPAPTPIGWVGAGYFWTTRATEHATDLLRIQLSTPSLSLGLRVSPAGYLRHLVFRDLEIGDLHFDRYHRVEARDPERATPLVRAVVAAMRAHPAIGILEHWDDRGIQWRTYGGLDESLGALRAVQATLAQEIDALATPRDVEISSTAWHALAAELGGTFTPGLLHLSGTIASLPFELSLVRTRAGAASALAIWLGDARTASPQARAHRWSRPPGTSPGPLPQPAAAALAGAATQVELRAIVDGEVTARLGLTERDASGRLVLDAAQARAALDAAAAVRLALDGTGPYR
jgi:hypothetical protein